jgi:hypothetical protein
VCNHEGHSAQPNRRPARDEPHLLMRWGMPTTGR